MERLLLIIIKKISLLVVNVIFESKMGVSTLPSQGHPVVVKRIEKNHVDLTRTVLLELNLQKPQ